jgi:predicted nucleic acid-binding protein
MKYVLDSSIAIKWALSEIDSPEADQIRADFQHHGLELISVDVFVVEVAHALTRAERRGVLPPGESIRLLTDVMSSLPVLHPILPLIGRAIELSSQHRIGVYDCLFIALAEQENCDVLTADVRLARTFSNVVLLKNAV